MSEALALGLSAAGSVSLFTGVFGLGSRLLQIRWSACPMRVLVHILPDSPTGAWVSHCLPGYSSLADSIFYGAFLTIFLGETSHQLLTSAFHAKSIQILIYSGFSLILYFITQEEQIMLIDR